MSGELRPPVLRLRGVTKRYGDFLAVGDLSVEIPSGVIYGMLGPNGAGKTTTLRMVNDILAPDEGEIRLFDDLRPGRIAGRRIGYLPEERGLYPKMRVADELRFFGELRGLGRRVASQRAGRWLERLDLTQWARNKVQDLSKGMQQKVQFAAALLHEPELLILDEPWSGLDPINAEVLREIVVAERDAGRTILFSTHLMEQAEQICDHVCLIVRGRKVLDGPLDRIKREAAGDRLVALDFVDPAAEARARDSVLADPSLVSAMRARRGYLEVEMAGRGQEPADRLLAQLVGQGIGLRRFELVQPSLHQIFVDKVGAENSQKVGTAEVARA
ncbi:MAG TPA: ATP-binding cassette domain-containing protein [Kofleriaceae bacterium]|nr:ATP-binding cassette domain-containing protein [Kofleriaceae bacterium]